MKTFLFKIRCTSTCDTRFELNKVYVMYYKKDRSGGIIITPYNRGCFNPISIYINTTDARSVFKRWYDKCNWIDYDFEYVSENDYCVDLL